MRAILDPNFKREFGQPVRFAETLPKRRPAQPDTKAGGDASSAARLALLSQPGQAPKVRPRRKLSASDEAKLRSAKRTLWKAGTKDWLRKQDRGADWELPHADEKVLMEWFEAIDIDR